MWCKLENVHVHIFLTFLFQDVFYYKTDYSTFLFLSEQTELEHVQGVTIIATFFEKNYLISIVLLR